LEMEDGTRMEIPRSEIATVRLTFDF